MTSADICAALRERYKQPEWSIFFEVGNATGARCDRHADALAMNMYPSRGLSIIGFEIKVSRGDLVRELLKPDKAEPVAQYCNEWWLVTGGNLIKESDVIPATWGVLNIIPTLRGWPRGSNWPRTPKSFIGATTASLV